MSIGTTLAEARRLAGLTVGQVSEKTRIRETIIKGIERDDYAACGGDFYARGHIRAIARVVGTDPAPLIQEYDETLRAPEEITAAEAFRPAMPLGKRAPGGEQEPAGRPPEPVADPVAGREPGQPQPREQPWKRGPAGDREPAWRRGPLWRRGTGREPGSDEQPGPGPSGLVTETGPDGEPDTQPQPVVTAPIPGPAPVTEPFTEPARRVGELMPADTVSLFTAAGGRGPSASGPRLGLGPPRLNWTYALALALLAAIGVLGYLLVGGSGHAATGSPAASSGSGHAANRSRGAGHAKRSTAPTPARTTAPPAATPVQSLSPVSATAFGPSGVSQGDNPQLAQLAISGGAWHTDWYTTANFGNAQSGTGLLLDMGRPMTITGAQLTLGNSAGANLQLRAGNTPTLANLSPVAAASNAGGSLQLSLSAPVTCRYVLIWFTYLPPDASGTFQASVSNVKLKVVT